MIVIGPPSIRHTKSESSYGPTQKSLTCRRADVACDPRLSALGPETIGVPAVGEIRQYKPS